MKKKIMITLMLATALATPVSATTYVTTTDINACYGMYGDARYEHCVVPEGTYVEGSGNENGELRGFYWGGTELFIQPRLLRLTSGGSDSSGSNSSSSAKKSSDGAYNRVEVDLTSQTVVHYNWSGELDFSCEIASGLPGYDTPTGWYSILYKERNTSLKGTRDGVAYDTPVSYWMPFINTANDSQIGFHDAGWKEVYSGSNVTNGSLGCINMNPDDAATLYGLVEEGTTVYVHY